MAAPLGQRPEAKAKALARDPRRPARGPATADDEPRGLLHVGAAVHLERPEHVEPPPRPAPGMRGQRDVVRRVAMIHQKPPTRLERAAHAPKRGQVLALAEVAEAREETDHRVELR